MCIYEYFVYCCNIFNENPTGIWNYVVDSRGTVNIQSFSSARVTTRVQFRLIRWRIKTNRNASVIHEQFRPYFNFMEGTNSFHNSEISMCFTNKDAALVCMMRGVLSDVYLWPERQIRDSIWINTTGVDNNRYVCHCFIGAQFHMKCGIALSAMSHDNCSCP